MKNLKRKTDELDKNSFFRIIALDPDERLINECPYPDDLSQQVGDYCECEICDDDIRENCTFFQEKMLPFMILLEDFPGGTSFQ
jgi:hypothetical protein